MKMQAISFAAALAMIMAMPASADVVNLIPNAGFEAGTYDPFYEYNPGGLPQEGDPYTVTSNNPHSGNFCVYRGWGYPGSLRVDIENGPMIADIQELSYWVRMESEPAYDTSLYSILDFTDMETGTTYGLATLHLNLSYTGEWVHLDVSEGVREAGLGREFRIDAFMIGGYASCSFSIDDIVLVAPEPVSLGLLSAGALCMMYRRPRRRPRF